MQPSLNRDVLRTPVREYNQRNGIGGTRSRWVNQNRLEWQVGEGVSGARWSDLGPGPARHMGFSVRYRAETSKRRAAQIGTCVISNSVVSYTFLMYA